MGGVQAKLQKKYSVDDIPNEILQEVFLRLLPRDLKSCYLVCKRFAACLDQRGFWIEKCVQDSIFSPNLYRFLGENDDFRKLYLKGPYERNLINTGGVLSRDCMQFKMPESMRCKWGKQVKEYADTDPRSQWTTERLHRYGDIMTSWFTVGIIDLLDKGCSEHVLDVVRPSIRVLESYAPDGLYQVRYTLKVALLTEKNEYFWEQTLPENCLYVFEDVLESGREWKQTEHVFNDYPAGVRYIGYFNKGEKVSRFAGFADILSSVSFDFSHTAFTERDTQR